ncbi:hypothetical protein [Luteibacter sp.]|uniref:hypothetical protein n=1 Tax=Luteibacter sp. TaxID=1886636 RepID=UPI00280908FA|nr:hypothetical protein [Luteibacter sp.]MDQ8050693.1 hypothetical protein [Luteibacter sp.]
MSAVVLHSLGRLLRDHDYYEFEELSEHDIQELAGHGIVEAWYWYGYGCYSGTGELIGKMADGKWAIMCLGHCSCYGPCNDAPDSLHDSLDAIVAYAFAERTDRLQPLIDLARSQGAE